MTQTYPLYIIKDYQQLLKESEDFYRFIQHLKYKSHFLIQRFINLFVKVPNLVDFFSYIILRITNI